MLSIRENEGLAEGLKGFYKDKYAYIYRVIQINFRGVL